MRSNLSGVDEVFRVSSSGQDQGTMVEMLQRAFDRVGELAARHDLVSPLTVHLTDADTRRLLTMTMSLGETGWSGKTESGELDAREGISFPWFLVLQDTIGMSVKIRVELDASSLLM